MLVSFNKSFLISTVIPIREEFHAKQKCMKQIHPASESELYHPNRVRKLP